MPYVRRVTRENRQDYATIVAEDLLAQGQRWEDVMPQLGADERFIKCECSSTKAHGPLVRPIIAMRLAQINKGDNSKLRVDDVHVTSLRCGYCNKAIPGIPRNVKIYDLELALRAVVMSGG